MEKKEKKGKEKKKNRKRKRKRQRDGETYLFRESTKSTVSIHPQGKNKHKVNIPYSSGVVVLYYGMVLYSELGKYHTVSYHIIL